MANKPGRFLRAGFWKHKFSKRPKARQAAAEKNTQYRRNIIKWALFITPADNIQP
jgi:hypothetical protein